VGSIPIRRLILSCLKIWQEKAVNTERPIKDEEKEVDAGPVGGRGGEGGTDVAAHKQTISGWRQRSTKQNKTQNEEEKKFLKKKSP